MKSLTVLALFAISFVFVGKSHAAAYINLPVPFTAEAPTGKWVDPWFNGCEEASVVMVDQYYLGKTSLTSSEAVVAMQRLFDWEDKTFGYNTDASAAETVLMINESSSFKGTIKYNPTVEEVKAELDDSHPVIAPLNGILFYGGKVYGNGYHMLVIKGYDDVNNEFIVNDDGSNTRGRDFRVSYEIMVKAFNDFDHTTEKLSGIPTAIFTSPKKDVVKQKPEIIPEKITISVPKIGGSNATNTPMLAPTPVEKVGFFKALWRFIRSLFYL